MGELVHGDGRAGGAVGGGEVVRVDLVVPVEVVHRDEERGHLEQVVERQADLAEQAGDRLEHGAGLDADVAPDPAVGFRLDAGDGSVGTAGARARHEHEAVADPQVRVGAARGGTTGDDHGSGCGHHRSSTGPADP
jgi:hypothetical protein